jgi:hypothetical protein
MEWTVAIGVDTHKDVHVAVALDGFGAQLGSREVETTAAGYRSLLSWALELGRPVFAVEGAGLPNPLEARVLSAALPTQARGLSRAVRQPTAACLAAAAKEEPAKQAPPFV